MKHIIFLDIKACTRFSRGERSDSSPDTGTKPSCLQLQQRQPAQNKTAMMGQSHLRPLARQQDGHKETLQPQND